MRRQNSLSYGAISSKKTAKLPGVISVSRDEIGILGTFVVIGQSFALGNLLAEPLSVWLCLVLSPHPLELST